MSRRFVNLLVNRSIGRRPSFNLHRIDLASLFCPTGSPKPADPAAAKKALAPAPAQLPPAAVSFNPRNGWMDFIAINDDVIAVDDEGRALLYDAAIGALRPMSPMGRSRCDSISLIFGDYWLFVMTREVGWYRQVHHLQVLDFTEAWIWHPFPPLTFDKMDFIMGSRYQKYKMELEQVDLFDLAAYTAVGDREAWVSTVGVGTYSFGRTSGKWSKIGDWALPFSGRAHYVAEHGLWFGFSDDQLCAADLKQQPPAPPLRKFPLSHLWEEPPLPEAWTPTATSLLPMGSGKLCIARCFRTSSNGEKLLPSDYGHGKKAESFAVLAGVEIVEHAGTGSLQMIKHNSVCYSVGKNVVKVL